MAVNVRGVFLGCKYAIPAMIASGGGSIINIASFVALLGCSVPQDAYTASKGALLSLTRSLAVQFGPKGIRTNAICPGPDRDAAADGLAAQGRGGQAAPARAQPHRAVRQARGDRVHGALPRLGRIAVDQWRVSSSSTAASASTTSERSGAAMAAGRIAIGVDVGGSGIKAAVVDVESGQLAVRAAARPDPVPSTPDAVIASIARLVKRLVTARPASARRPRSASGCPA